MPTSWRMNSKNGLPRRWAMFSLLPVKRLSTHSTSSPACNNASQRCEPRNPAPPVTRTFFMMVSPEDDAANRRRTGGASVGGPRQRPLYPRVLKWIRATAMQEPRPCEAQCSLPDAKPELQRDRGTVMWMRREEQVGADAAVFGAQCRQHDRKPVAMVGVGVAV